jgi:hypothetical protein
MDRDARAGTDAVTPWNVNWGVFVIDDGYRGCFIRAIPAADSGLISHLNPANRSGVVFNY